MNSPSTRLDVLPERHQSGSPWLRRMGAREVLNITGHAQPRWLQVQRGNLWVTAARGTPGPVGREADIWLAAGDSLPLPPGSSWLLQAWPAAELTLLQQAPLQQAPAQPGRALLAGQAGAAARVLRRVATALARPVMKGPLACSGPEAAVR